MDEMDNAVDEDNARILFEYMRDTLKRPEWESMQVAWRQRQYRKRNR